MWICPVCLTENYNLICSDCGFDESQNYVRYPSLVALSPEMLAKAGKQWRSDKDLLSAGYTDAPDSFQNDNFWSVPGDDLSGEKYSLEDIDDNFDNLNDDIFDNEFSKDKAKFWKFKVDDTGTPKDGNIGGKTDGKGDDGDKIKGKDADHGKLKGIDLNDTLKYKNIKGVYYCTDCGHQLENVCSDGLVCKRCGRMFAVDAQNNVEEVEEGTAHPFFTLLFEAEKYRQANMWNKELAILKKIMKRFGITSFIMVKMGRAYRCLNNYTKAMECYRRALQINPEDGLIYSNMGVLCYTQGNYDTAIYYYRQAMRYMDDQDSEFCTFLANYALALGTMGNKDQAAFMINRAEKLGYRNADIVRKKIGI